jgi:hypothetical protein
MGGFSQGFQSVPQIGGAISQSPYYDLAATNLCLMSENLDNGATWIQAGGIGITANSAEAPNGQTAADGLLSAVGALGSITQAIALAADNNRYVASGYFSNITNTPMRLQITLVTTGDIFYADVNSGGVVTAVSPNLINGSEVTVEKVTFIDNAFLPALWYRLAFKFTNKLANAGGFSFAIICKQPPAGQQSGATVWGMQVERVSVVNAGKASQQIPTFTGAITRQAGYANFASAGLFSAGTNAFLIGTRGGINNALQITDSGGTNNRWFTIQGSAGANPVLGVNGGTIQLAGNVIIAGGSITVGTAVTMVGTNSAWNNGAGAAAGTLLNAPVAGNPTKWIQIDDAGTARYVPAW